MLQHPLGFGSEADHQARALRMMRDGFQYVGILHQLDHRRIAVFLDFLLRHLLRPPVSHRCGAHRHLYWQAHLAGGEHFLRSSYTHHLYPRRIGNTNGPGHQRHLRPQFRQRLRHRVPLPPGGAVAEEAHRVERLMRRPAGHQHADAA